VQGTHQSEGGLAAAHYSSAGRTCDEEEASLRSHFRQERKKRRKQRKIAFGAFDLSGVNEQIIEFIADSGGSNEQQSNSLELPDFSKMQRVQVSQAPYSARTATWYSAMNCAVIVPRPTDRCSHLLVLGRCKPVQILLPIELMSCSKLPC